MKTKQEIKNWILQNCVDVDGDINLKGLDFSDFDGNIYKGEWKVKGDLYQSGNEVEGSLYQSRNVVKGTLWQGSNEVEDSLYQDSNEVKGTLHQANNKVEDSLFQSDNKVEGKLWQGRNVVKGDLNQYRNKVKGQTYNDFDQHTEVLKYENEKWVTDFKPKPNYENMSREELIEIIKKLKKEVLND